jgi:hypothetical protein
MDSDLAVWQTANQMMRMYPQNSVWAAAELSNAALETGDMVNYKHWLLVSCAILKLQQSQAAKAVSVLAPEQRDCA